MKSLVGRTISEMSRGQIERALEYGMGVTTLHVQACH